jgi:hypothetical protein
MAPLSPRLSLVVTRWARRLFARLAAPGVAALALLGPGCVATNPFRAADPNAAPPVAPVKQAVALWNRNVVYAPDPVRQGQPYPALMGRLYLFGADETWPVAADGTLVVSLFDDTPRPGKVANPQAPALEEWRFEKAMLAPLLKKDTIGWGYTICLPWATYRPDVGVVRLTARYEAGAGGAALFAPAAPITLDHGQTPPQFQAAKAPSVAPQAVVPGAAGPAAPPPVEPAKFTPAAQPQSMQVFPR